MIWVFAVALGMNSIGLLVLGYQLSRFIRAATAAHRAQRKTDDAVQVMQVETRHLLQDLTAQVLVSSSRAQRLEGMVARLADAALEARYVEEAARSREAAPRPPVLTPQPENKAFEPRTGMTRFDKV